MTDISRLFTSPSTISRNTIVPTYFDRTSFRPPNQTYLKTQTQTQQWRLDNLESSLKRSIKTYLTPNALKEQMRHANSKISTNFQNNFMACLLITFIFFCLSQWDHVIAFYLLLFLLSQIFLNTSFKLFQGSVINRGIILTKPIFYCAFSYSVLKNLAGVNMSLMSSTYTYFSIVLAFIYLVLQFLGPIARLENHSVILGILTQKSIVKKMKKIPMLFMARITFLKRIFQYVFPSTVLFSTLLLGVFWYSQAPLMDILRPINLFYLLVTFLIIEGLLLLLTFTSQGWICPMAAVVDKMPVFLTLFRLPSSCENVELHRLSEISLYLKMRGVSCYLSTETCKSLLFPNYMSLFMMHTSTQLQKLHKDLFHKETTIQHTHKTLYSNQNIIHDLFIWIRKAKAILVQFYNAVDALKQLEKQLLLLKIVWLAEEQAIRDKDMIRVDSSVKDLLSLIRERVGKINKKSTMVGLGIKQELQAMENRLLSWEVRLKQ